jgi:hypothetical protein
MGKCGDCGDIPVIDDTIEFEEVDIDAATPRQCCLERRHRKVSPPESGV